MWNSEIGERKSDTMVTGTGWSEDRGRTEIERGGDMANSEKQVRAELGARRKRRQERRRNKTAEEQRHSKSGGTNKRRSSEKKTG
jgi:hypothetical protein